MLALIGKVDTFFKNNYIVLLSVVTPFLLVSTLPRMVGMLEPLPAYVHFLQRLDLLAAIAYMYGVICMIRSYFENKGRHP